MTIRRAAAIAGAAAVLSAPLVGCSNDDDGAPGADRPAPTAAPRTTVAAASTTPTAPDVEVVPTSVAVRLTDVATAEAPIAMAIRPGTNEIYVAERAGTVARFTQRDGTWTEAGRSIDIRRSVGEAEGERGLLGIAITPDGDRLIVSYTDSDDEGASVIESYALDEGVAVPASRIEILRLAQPFPNHNGGNIVIGPEGDLYIGFGDGGNQGDPDDRAQDLGDLLGKILRLDISSSTKDEPYRIPADNPFVGRAGARGEIWAFGLRNPWRFSFDRGTGDLWIGDVGGALWEEIDHLPATGGAGRGTNLGWSLREGPDDTEKTGDRSGFVDPVHAYHHDQGQSVVGGVVSRSAALPGLAGVYFYCDTYQGDLRALVVRDGGLAGQPEVTLSGDELNQVVSFGEDADGRIYLLSLTGSIRRIDPA